MPAPEAVAAPTAGRGRAACPPLHLRRFHTHPRGSVLLASSVHPKRLPRVDLFLVLRTGQVTASTWFKICHSWSLEAAFKEEMGQEQVNALSDAASSSVGWGQSTQEQPLGAGVTCAAPAHRGERPLRCPARAGEGPGDPVLSPGHKPHSLSPAPNARAGLRVPDLRAEPSSGPREAEERRGSPQIFPVVLMEGPGQRGARWGP